MLWVIMITVVPAAFDTRREASKMRSSASTSMPESGSSMSTRRGSMARMEASSMRLRSPPESVLSTCTVLVALGSQAPRGQ